MGSYKVLTEDGSALRRYGRHLKSTQESHTPTTQMSKQTELPSPPEPTKQETNASGPSSSEVARPQEQAIKQPASISSLQREPNSQWSSNEAAVLPERLCSLVRYEQVKEKPQSVTLETKTLPDMTSLTLSDNSYDFFRCFLVVPLFLLFLIKGRM